MPSNNKPFNNILELIGNTPLIRLNEVTKNFKGTYFTKFEGFNPGHSNKDRIALHILNQAEKKGILKKGSTIIETTSGNTGFSLALVSLLKGYKCILAVSSKASKDKINMLKCLGAKIYVCPSNVPSDDPRSYYEVAKRLTDEIKGSVYINQYFNDLNVEAHYQTTGPEIWSQTNGKITHLIACSGTGGTISGIGRFLKEKNNDVKLMIVGENYISLKKYKILIDKLGISKNIIFKNEYVKNNDVKYWFSASELVILPYKTASQSGIIPLSIKFETPVVCSNINGLKEDVIDNQTGFLFERSVENLSNKINYALNTNKKKIISNIIKHKKNLSWNNFNKELLKNRHE